MMSLAAEQSLLSADTDAPAPESGARPMMADEGVDGDDEEAEAEADEVRCETRPPMPFNESPATLAPVIEESERVQ